MQGVVQQLKNSRNGKPQAVINGLTYSAGRTDISGMQVGMNVEFDAHEFKPNLWGLDKWKPLKTQVNDLYQQPSNQLAPPQSNPSRVAQVVTITEVDVLRSVSNIVGNACAAGTVKTPEELEKWFTAAWDGLTRRYIPDYQEPEFDDNIPL